MPRRQHHHRVRHPRTDRRPCLQQHPLFILQRRARHQHLRAARQPRPQLLHHRRGSRRPHIELQVAAHPHPRLRHPDRHKPPRIFRALRQHQRQHLQKRPPPSAQPQIPRQRAIGDARIHHHYRQPLHARTPPAHSATTRSLPAPARAAAAPERPRAPPRADRSENKNTALHRNALAPVAGRFASSSKSPPSPAPAAHPALPPAGWRPPPRPQRQHAPTPAAARPAHAQPALRQRPAARAAPHATAGRSSHTGAPASSASNNPTL